MKFLVDNQLPKALVSHLQARGHDCEHVLDVRLAAAADISICVYAEQQERVLISKDEDFLYLSNRPASKVRLVWVRLGNCRTKQLLAAFDQFGASIESRFAAGEKVIEIR